MAGVANHIKMCTSDFSDSFKDGSSKLNNHSAMTVAKFILALSDQLKFRFILKLFSLITFCMKMI